MSRYVLDTDTLSLLSQGHASITSRALSVPPDELAITIVTVEEVFIGRYSQIRRARTSPQVVAAYSHLQRAIELFRSVGILPFDERASVRFDALHHQHRRVGTNDLRIAAIALEHGAFLVTRNLVDFQPIAGASVVDWSI